MSHSERALCFACGNARLLAVISSPPRAFRRGVLLVVGGPQYRAGSHRQFTLLCRALAERGIAAMRFDYRGMGDSEGEMRSFEDVLPDIRAAIDQLCLQHPEVSEVAIWGLCDAASAALLYAHQDARVTGLVLLNPWVRTSTGIAKTRLKHYYGSRLLEGAFWRKFARGELALGSAARSFAGTVATALGAGQGGAAPVQGGTAAPARRGAGDALPERMAEGLSLFGGRVLLVLSGKDLTAREFDELAGASARWKRLLETTRVERRELGEADHTFSRREWRDQVAVWTGDWVLSW